MVFDPLGHIRHRGHDALRGWCGVGELKMLILTLLRLRHRTDRNDQLDQAHITCSVIAACITQETIAAWQSFIIA
jgi:hypothetical protein